MPTATGAHRKYHYQDHDTDVLEQVPPVQNTWYEVFHAYDVRLLWCVFEQLNDEEGNKTVEIRWTIDGNVYFWGAAPIPNDTPIYVYRHYPESALGTDGLEIATDAQNAAFYTDKRGQDFKVEIRLTAAAGTNQELNCYCVRETLETT